MRRIGVVCVRVERVHEFFAGTALKLSADKTDRKMKCRRREKLAGAKEIRVVSFYSVLNVQTEQLIVKK